MLPRFPYKVLSPLPFGKYNYTHARRFAAVKELNWCTPKSTSLKKKDEWSNSSSSSCKTCKVDDNLLQEGDSQISSYSSIGNMNRRHFCFGIISAMNQDRIIGVNGSIPWNVAEDRKHFVDITRDKILIIGRNTFYERGKYDFSHVSHCQDVIVVSNTLKEHTLFCDGEDFQCKLLQPNLHIVESFNGALKLAETIINTVDGYISREKSFEVSYNDDDIDCWVGGGQRIYEEALRNPLAKEIHLTHIMQSSTEIKDLKSFIEAGKVSYFPTKYRYDHKFKECKDLRRISKDCQFYTYRKRGK